MQTSAVSDKKRVSDILIKFIEILLAHYTHFYLAYLFILRSCRPTIFPY